MTQAVAKKETGAVALATVAQPTETILKSDVVIPKVLLMQGMSDFVTEGSAKMGDMVKSTTREILGDAKKSIEVIPLTFKNTWVLSEKIGEKYEFRGITERNAKNEQDPWEFTEKGTQWKRTKSIDLFALLPSDVAAEAAEIKNMQETGEMPDLTKTLLPVVISFRSTSYKAGRAIATHFAQAQGMAKFGVKAYGFTLTLSCIKDSNDKGTYYVWSVKNGTRVPKEMLDRASDWYGVVATQAVKVDEDSENKAAPGSTETQF